MFIIEPLCPSLTHPVPFSLYTFSVSLKAKPMYLIRMLTKNTCTANFRSLTAFNKDSLISDHIYRLYGQIYHRLKLFNTFSLWLETIQEKKKKRIKKKNIPCIKARRFIFRKIVCLADIMLRPIQSCGSRYGHLTRSRTGVKKNIQTPSRILFYKI